MHPVADHWNAVPIGGVHESVGTVDRPSVGHGTIKQRLGGWQQPVRRIGKRCLQMEQQSRPLQTVPDRGPVRLKLVVRAIPVVFELRLPARIEVFGNPPCVRLREFHRYPARDAQGTLAERMIAGHICSGQQGLDAMHVGIDTPIIAELGEAAVPRVDEHSGFSVEESLVPDPERVVEQVASTGQPHHGTRGSGQHHESMRVTRLLVRSPAIGVDAGQPTAAGPILQPAGQPSKRLRCQIKIARSTQ